MRVLTEVLYWELINALDEYVLKYKDHPDFPKSNLFPSQVAYNTFRSKYKLNEVEALTYLIHVKYECYPKRLLILKNSVVTWSRGYHKDVFKPITIYKFFHHVRSKSHNTNHLPRTTSE